MKSLALLLLTLSLGAPSADPDGDALSTQRRVHGVITSVDATKLTIATSQKTVTGRIDPARTLVTLRGRPARTADLEITAHAKAELCLDDVWLRIDAH